MAPLASRLRHAACAAFMTAATLGGLPSQARATEFTDAQKQELGPIIQDYLIKNPEVVRDAIAALEQKQKADDEAHRVQVLSDNTAALFDSPYQGTVGNLQGKVAVVEFFDYNCGYCKRALDDMGKLIKTEPNLKLVLRDFPVLGPGSVEAAQVATAVRNQLKGDKFWAYHVRLLSMRGPIGKAQALSVAKDLGLDMDQLAKDMDKPDVKAGIAQTMKLADALNLTGTPSFVIGKTVVVGAVGYDELKGHVDSMLQCGKADC